MSRAVQQQGGQIEVPGLRISDLRAAGITSANGLAKALNERHAATARGSAVTEVDPDA
jgi:hypothetical protein